LEKGTVKSILTEIDGIGYNYAQKLLWKFKSVKNIQKASLSEIQDTIGRVKGMIVFDYFNASREKNRLP